MKSFILKSSIYLLALLFLTNCSKKEDTPTPTPTPTEDPIVMPSYNGPTYFDSYVSLAAWSSRSQWNLANIHDPTVEKCGDYYYMSQTDASYGNSLDGNGHFFLRRSKDLVNWEFMGPTMQTAPAWVKDSLNNKRARIGLPPIANPTYGYWAPCIRKAGNKYRMYYSIVVIEPIVGTSTSTSWSERAFIGLAETDDLATNTWTDKGMVVCSEPDGVRSYTRNGDSDWSAYFKFNAIDPSFITTPEGEQWLIYGSWHTGIAALKLNPATGKPDKLETVADYGVRIAGRGNIASNRWQALEGPEIIYNPETGYYYLFVAYDGLDVPYNTRVARSKSITGPYVGIDGQNVSNGAEAWPMLTHPYAFANHSGWVGISHCAVFQNPDTKEWFYSSQGRLPENYGGNPYSNAIMMGHVRSIHWTEDGWPVVSPERYAGVPNTAVPEKSLIGSWEQITLEYQYRVQQKPITIKLTSDYKAVGSNGSTYGTWSYDSTKGILTISTTIASTKLKVKYDWDWEASPRKVTITFAGINSSGRVIWGKKIQ